VSERDFSVVVFGATGVTGRQVAAYLARRPGEADVRWAAAGRNPARIEQVLGEVGVTAPQILTADVDDPESLRAMAARTSVVLDLVGPYTLYGEPVIEACIEAGAHYADLTGEMAFVRRMIDAHEEKAKERGVKIVNTSGFESLPVDLCVLLAAETARKRWDEGLTEVDVDADIPLPSGRLSTADLVSGGTLQSMAVMLEEQDGAALVDPGILLAEAEAAAVRQASPIAIAPRFDERGQPVGPMMPGPFINPMVIHRSAALLAAIEGRPFEPFRYREGVVTSLGRPAPVPLRLVVAAVSAGFQAGFRALAKARPSTRLRAAGLLRKRLPSSGFGPQGSRLEDWHWTLSVRASTSGGHHLRVELDADGQPGYLATATMLAEAGLLLAEPGATPDRSGFLTPALAVGTQHLERFHPAGARFRIAS
jgi:short subunit dehydrogenase-like uncharacterized protein